MEYITDVVKITFPAMSWWAVVAIMDGQYNITVLFWDLIQTEDFWLYCRADWCCTEFGSCYATAYWQKTANFYHHLAAAVGNVGIPVMIHSWNVIKHNLRRSVHRWSCSDMKQHFSLIETGVSKQIKQ